MPAGEIALVRCCIVGGGPAGMMLGFLLARAGVEVLVLEKHADFLRDFRGDTIHPSTLEVMHELGLLDEFLRLPHQEATQLTAQIGGTSFPIADFRHLPTRCRFVAFMPQWDFLDFLAEQAARYPTFRLRMQAEVTGLIEEQGRVVGVRATTPDGPLEVRADLVVGADGRHSAVRERAGLEVARPRRADGRALVPALAAARRPRPADGPLRAGPAPRHAQPGRLLAVRLRDPQGLRSTRSASRAFEAFREAVAGLAPFARERVDELRDWDEVKLLTVRVDRLAPLVPAGPALHRRRGARDVAGRRRRDQPRDPGRRRGRQPPGRAAARGPPHHRPPAPGAAAAGAPDPGHPADAAPGAGAGDRAGPGRRGKLSPPLALRLLARFPLLRRLPARLIGIGVRPEHVAPTMQSTNGTSEHQPG